VYREPKLAYAVTYQYDRYPTQETGSRNVAKFKLTATVARQRVRELAAETTDTVKLVWTEHIQEQMEKRGIDSDAVLRILRNGDIEGDPLEGNKPGDWKIKLTLKMATGRVAGVVAAITRDGCLVLITTEWEDHR
jgi:predicted kinase